MAVDDFDIDIISSFGGYVSAKDKTNVAKNVLVRGSKNVYKKDSGTIAVRPGLKRRGASDETIAGIASSYEWYTSLGATRVLRIIEETVAGNDGKLQVEAADASTWYDLMTGMSETRAVFDTWWDNTEKKDRVIFVNHEDSLKHWSGGVAEAAPQVAGGATLTKADTSTTWAQDGFATNTAGEKKFKIAGSATEYTYTGGESTTTLTGITPALPTINAGDIVLQSVITEASTPAAGFLADFIRTVNNQIYVGSYTSRLVYISNDTDFTDFVVPTPREPGDPDLLTLDNAGKGIGIRDGKAHVSAGLSDWYIVSFNQITVGTTLTEQTIVDKQKVANLSAAYAHEFIDMVGDDIVYLSQDQQLRVFGTFRNISTPKYPSLSQQIKEELQQEDFTGGHLRSVGDFIYITAPVNNKVYLHQTRESVSDEGNIVADRFWHPPQEWYATRLAVIGGVEFVHSSQNPQLYQVWNTEQWHDDSPDDVPVPYEGRMKMSYRSHGRRQGILTFDKVYYEGYILSNTTLKTEILYDYLGASGENLYYLNKPGEEAALFDQAGRFGLGGDLVGEQTLGGGITETGEQNLPKFRIIVGTKKTDCFEYEIDIFSDEADSRWEILAMGTNATQSPRQAVFIKNSDEIV